VLLKGAFRGGVAFLVHAHGVGQHPVTDGEAGDGRTHRGDLPGQVRAEDEGVDDPPEDQRSGVLDDPVDGVHGHRAVLHEDLVGARSG